jgi:hypothetical protein
MTAADKIAIAQIVINVIIATVGWSILIWATRKTIQAALPTAKPVPKPKPKKTSVLTKKTMRFTEIILIGEVIFCITNLIASFLCCAPISRFELFAAIVNYNALVSSVVGIIVIEHGIKKGTFV